MRLRGRHVTGLLTLAVAMLGPVGFNALKAQERSMVDVAGSAIGGRVKSLKGPEAGVWVIAETTDLPTRFAKIVVTDDDGRYLIPDLPSANYKVWVRGYGLVDSEKRDARPGLHVDLDAKLAPDEAAAAQYYPGMYWYSMIHVPPASEFPGSDKSPTGMPANMHRQSDWVDTMKNMCQSCHGLGTITLRSPHTAPEPGESSADWWARRVQSGQAMGYMAVAIASIGPDRAYRMFADWTDRIKAGELPFDQPQRPVGVERNFVITSWDWGTPKMYLHDAISTDKRDPTVNANGLIYGSPEESSDFVPVLDPVHNATTLIKHPIRDPDTPSSLDVPHGTSQFWGDEQIWDGHTSNHNPMMDENGRVWFTARIRGPEDPDRCQNGAIMPSAAVTPLKESNRQLSVYDPKTDQWKLVDTCFTTQHLTFAWDKQDTLWLSSGGPQSGVVGWVDTKRFEETGDEVKSQGWTPIVTNTAGASTRVPFVKPDQPVEPGKDKWVRAAFYGVMPSPRGDVVWGQSMGPGFSRMDQPSYLVRFIPGKDPTQTAISEIFEPPEGSFGTRGVDVDMNGVAWTVLSSGHVASFDRSKCREPISGPEAATGKLCREGWTLYRMPGPQFPGLDPSGSANHAYYIWIDLFNVLGLGANVPIASANGGEELLALVNGKFINIRVPYPLGFFTKNVDGRIDDKNAGWKGRGIWTTSGTRANFHGEGGKGVLPEVFKIQLRPNPLDG